MLSGRIDDLVLVAEPGARPLADSLELARDSATRKRGLLGRAGLAPGVALVIAPCQAVHTFGMQFSIDVIFAARDGRVLKIRNAVPARRLAASVRAFATIEMAAGSAARAGLSVGDLLRVVTRPIGGDASSR
jgi:uncharacterized membrane protein (UPF0127 family)